MYGFKINLAFTYFNLIKDEMLQLLDHNPNKSCKVTKENYTLMGLGGEMEKPEWLGFVTVEKPVNAKNIAQAVLTELKDER